jgi:hypothetical protein
MYNEIMETNGFLEFFCNAGWGSDGHLKKVKTDNGRQVIA